MADAVIRTVAKHLGAALGDANLGRRVAESLDERAIDVLASLPPTELPSVLNYTPVTQREPTGLVVFAFGNRFGAGGGLLPGPVNLELAVLADAWAEFTGLPVVAQWEVADEMQTTARRVGVVELDDGSIEYLSTAGVAEQARDLLGGERVAVLAMADHAVRCCRTLERVGFVAGVPAGVELPMTYDPDSGQPWTRDRVSYLAIDILARCLTLPT